jgi:hypothetical protein
VLHFNDGKWEFIAMSIDTIRLPATPNRIAPVEPYLAPAFCLVLFAACCALASFALACATPFAAFAALAVAMLPLPTALLVVGAAWIVNQAIGFGVLHYPIDASTILWGFVIGVAALVATLTARVVLSVLRQSTAVVGLALALLGAYCAYELVLFAATPVLGGGSNFTVAIVARLGLLSTLWLIALVAICECVRQLDRFRSRQASGAGSHAENPGRNGLPRAELSILCYDRDVSPCACLPTVSLSLSQPPTAAGQADVRPIRSEGSS